MKKQDIYTLGLLYILTLATAYFSSYQHELKYISFIILGLSGIKFLLVAFQFIELKKAHNFWKVLLTAYLVIFIMIVGIVVQ